MRTLIEVVKAVGALVVALIIGTLGLLGFLLWAIPNVLRYVF